MKLLALLMLCIAISFPPTPATAAPAEEAESNNASATDDADRARRLLARAVTHFRAVGDRALAEFGRQGEFIDRELYVYVLDTEGTMLSSGGSSASLIGRNVTPMRDAAGKPFFAELVETAVRDGHGEVQYRWINWADNSVQRKHTFFERVDQRIIAVGYYVTRSSPEHARAFLEQAVAAMKASPRNAIEEFNRLDGRFAQDDLYVFAVDRRNGRLVAHGAMPRMVGADGLAIRDANGTPVIRNILDQLTDKGHGELDYHWKNPVTQRIEPKRTLFETVGDYVIAVGYFEP